MKGGSVSVPDRLLLFVVVLDMQGWAGAVLEEGAASCGWRQATLQGEERAGARAGAREGGVLVARFCTGQGHAGAGTGASVAPGGAHRHRAMQQQGATQGRRAGEGGRDGGARQGDAMQQKNGLGDAGT
jgi:hypothetical protein